MVVTGTFLDDNTQIHEHFTGAMVNTKHQRIKFLTECNLLYQDLFHTYPFLQSIRNKCTFHLTNNFSNLSIKHSEKYEV